MCLGVRQPQLASLKTLIAALQRRKVEACNRNDTFANFKSWPMVQDGGSWS